MATPVISSFSDCFIGSTMRSVCENATYKILDCRWQSSRTYRRLYATFAA